MEQNHLLNGSEAHAIEEAIAAEVAQAVAFAQAGTPEDPQELERFVTMDRVPQEEGTP